MEKGNKFIDEVNALVDNESAAANLASVFTIAWAGADEAENTYYLLCDSEVTFGALLIVSTDVTKNVNCVGPITGNEDGSITIVDETDNYTATIVTEEVEGGLIMTIDNELEVGMVSYNVGEIIDLVIQLESITENVN